MFKSFDKTRKRIFEVVEISNASDSLSRFYDLFYTFLILLNLAVSIAYTFDSIEAFCGQTLLLTEEITVAFFLLDYILRIVSAPCKYPNVSEQKAYFKYILSFMGIIDLLSFLPYYLPFFFPSGAVAFRLFRIIRIFRIFRINAYYDSLNVITEVIISKRQQLISSAFIIFILMIFSSMCMYSIENEAQPDVFKNAFSGIWWAVSTLLTVGYGDIYPITSTGKLFSIFITILGVGMIAIPTGIISAGFVDQYSRIKRMAEYGREADVNFIRVPINDTDTYIGRKVKELGLPSSMIVAAINRNNNVIVPKGDTVIEEKDVLVIGAESVTDDHMIELKEVVLSKNNPWVGKMIKELDISRLTLIVMIKRSGKNLIPSGSTILEEGDMVILYTQSHIPDSIKLEV